jgi:hypothetical protein
MSSGRSFEPHFVFATGPWFVAVDRIQPVAVVLSAGGQLASTVSWADVVAAPLVTPWPSRQAVAAADRVVVQDLPDGTPVTLTVDADGRARAGVEPVPEGLLRPARHSRLWRAGPRIGPADPAWTFGSALDGFSWTGRIAHPGAPDLEVSGSIIDFDAAGGAAVACVQRVDKRPWPFRRPSTLLALSTGDTGIRAREVAALDIGELCWPRFADRWGPADLHEYLRFTLNQVAAATEAGIRDARVQVREVLTDPRIELFFRHPDVPDREFVQVDRPFNELGNLGEGLRECGVSLAEDIGAGTLAHCAARSTGPVVRC